MLHSPLALARRLRSNLTRRHLEAAAALNSRLHGNFTWCDA